jgi:hypothetical protein
MEYSQYESYIEAIVKENDLSNFKSNPTYNHILEHVSPEYGYKYLQIIRNHFHLPDVLIKMFGHINDSIGGPQKIMYDNDLYISPTSLRYICHALLILTHMKECGLTEANIVEVGCGYGGLAYAISFFSSQLNVKINEYNFIDLNAPLQLQKSYMEKCKVDFPVFFHQASTFGEGLTGNDYFLISNYCFSEIEDHLQSRYIKTLFPKCTHGFLTWNHIDVYDIGKQCKVEEEYPLTGHKNKYVTF